MCLGLWIALKHLQTNCQQQFRQPQQVKPHTLSVHTS